MRHFVFTAANIPENEDAINRALSTVSNLEWHYDMNATVTGVYEGSKFIINHNDGNNTSVSVEDDDIWQLIETCMDFARENERLKQEQ